MQILFNFKYGHFRGANKLLRKIQLPSGPELRDGLCRYVARFGTNITLLGLSAMFLEGNLPMVKGNMCRFGYLFIPH